MTGISLLHTPEGVRDIYGEEYARKKTVADRIEQVLHRFGYRDIQTPAFEFFDIFSKEKGSVSSREMFKFFDRDGNTLVLRPDITPSVARSVAKYYMFEDMPLRLCYAGETFVNNMSLRGSLKETTVMGAELINDTTSDADAEMVAMLTQCLMESGLRDFQVEIGLVDYVNGLMQDAGLTEEQHAELRELLSQKNEFGMEALLEAIPMEPSVREALLLCPKLFGGIGQLRRARELTENERAQAALDRLEKLYTILSAYGLEKYVSFDLGMPGKFRYYTGVIFQAYTYGTGTPVAAGGRYDKLLAQFGKDAPATGVAIYLDALLTALSRQDIRTETAYSQMLLVYERRQKEKAVRLAGRLREAGADLTLAKRFYEKTFEDYEAYAMRMGMSGILYLGEDGEMLSLTDPADGKKTEYPYELLFREGPDAFRKE